MATAYDLPLRAGSAPSFRFQTDLDGTVYSFAFTWNERVSAWFMEISDADESPIVSGVRVVVGFPLAARPTDERMFSGLLLAEDTSKQNSDPGLDDFGSRVKLRYYSVVE